MRFVRFRALGSLEELNFDASTEGAMQNPLDVVGGVDDIGAAIGNALRILEQRRSPTLRTHHLPKTAWKRRGRSAPSCSVSCWSCERVEHQQYHAQRTDKVSARAPYAPRKAAGGGAAQAAAAVTAAQSAQERTAAHAETKAELKRCAVPSSPRCAPS